MGTVKYTGPVASFHCPTNAEIRSLKVHFSPKQLGEGTPSPENVREIVGWDGVVVHNDDVVGIPNVGQTIEYEFGVLGKNKCPAATGTEIGQNWEYDQYNHYINISGLQPNCQYTLQCTITKVLTAGSQNRFYLVSRNGSSFINLAQSEVPVTASITRYSNDDGTIRIQLNNTFSLDTERAPYLTNIQIELGSTATTYEPYDPKHTVYGGWVDLISGEVCEEWVIDNLSTLSWVARYTGDTNKTLSASLTNSYSALEVNSPCVCEQYNVINYVNGAGALSSPDDKENGVYWYRNTGYTTVKTIYIVTGNNSNPSGQIAYKLITPNTYHLTPTALQTFLGQNNVWSNADYVEVEYDLHETQSILARKQFIVANQPHIVRPAAAPLQNFVTDVPAPLKECKVHFEPVQDLHGYDKPWPAGGGKNIAKPYDNSYVSSTYISFDYSAANGTFRCYGTASASSTHSSPSATNAVNNGATFILPAGTYTLSIIDGDGANIYAQCVSSDETVLAETTSYITFTTNESLTVFVRLKVAAAATVDKTVKIQLEAGSTATSYVPYENVCPISGWTGVEVYKAGKNLIDPTRFLPKAQLNNGTVTGATVYGIYSVPIPKNKTIYWSKTVIAASIGALADAEAVNGIPYYNGATNTNRTSYTWQSEDHSYLLLVMGNTNTDGGVSRNEMVCLDDDRNYALPTGTTIPIDWTTEAGTVYGGYVDLLTGEVWNTYQQVILDGDETLNVGTSAYNGTDGTNRYVTVPNHGCGTSTAAGCCDKAKLYNENVWGYPNTHRWGFTLNANTQLHIVFDNATVGITAETEDRTAAIKTWLSNNPMTFYIPRKNPELVGTLTPIQLKTLRGTNNIYSDSNGNLEVAYWSH